MDLDIETENSTDNATDYIEVYTQSMAMEHIFRELVAAVFMLCGISGDILIAYIVLRFHRMRTITNLILANWALADLGFLLSNPDTMRLLVVIDARDMPGEVMCFVQEAQEAFGFAITLFFNWMCLNWCLGAYWPGTQAKVRTLFRPALAVVWAFVALWTVTFGVCCINDYYVFSRHFAVWINFLLLVVSLVVINVMRGVQRCRKRTPQQSSLMIMIPTALLLTWISMYFSAILIFVAGSSFFLLVLFFVLDFVVYLNSIVVVMILLRYHKGFQACFFQIIKCARFRYSDSSLDFNSQESIDGGTQVTFNNSDRNTQNNFTV